VDRGNSRDMSAGAVRIEKVHAGVLLRKVQI
jgi:hypothetical protein